MILLGHVRLVPRARIVILRLATGATDLPSTVASRDSSVPATDACTLAHQQLSATRLAARLAWIAMPATLNHMPG